MALAEPISPEQLRPALYVVSLLPEETIGPEIPPPTKPLTLGPPGEMIWFHDFENRNVAAIVAMQGITTYVQLSEYYKSLQTMTNEEFTKQPLLRDEMRFIQKPLDRWASR